MQIRAGREEGFLTGSIVSFAEVGLKFGFQPQLEQVVKEQYHFHLSGLSPRLALFPRHDDGRWRQGSKGHWVVASISLKASGIALTCRNAQSSWLLTWHFGEKLWETSTAAEPANFLLEVGKFRDCQQFAITLHGLSFAPPYPTLNHRSMTSSPFLPRSFRFRFL